MPRILIERADDTRTYEETYLRFSDSESMSEVKLNQDYLGRISTIKHIVEVLLGQGECTLYLNQKNLK